MTAADLVKDGAASSQEAGEEPPRRRQRFRGYVPAAARQLRRHWLLIALAAFAFAASLAVQHWYFPLYSGDNDEPIYVLQAQMLLDGKITLSGATHGDFFRPWLTLQHDGRLYSEFLPGWPAVLAASQLLFGTMVLAPAAAAAAWVIATYVLARELLAGRTTALVAAGIVALSPLTLIHGGLFLSYVFTAALLTGAAACLVRGVRLGSRGALVGAGALLGAGLLTRPLDVALVALPCAVYALVRLRRRPREAAWQGLWVAVGAVPFVLVLAAYNARVTGSPLQAPLSAGGPLVNKLGFGQRQMVPDQPPFDYPLHTAVHGLLLGLRTLPGFLFGGALMVALAVVGVLPRRRRAERLLLLALTLAFPVGYLFWFTSILAATHAENGIGPHYYVPAFGFLAVLAAAGLVAVARLWRPALVVGLAVAVPVTAWAIPDKITVRHAVNDGYRQVRALTSAAAAPAVVLVAGTGYVPGPNPFLNNPPDLRAPVLYAADLGTRNNRIVERAPGRRVFRLAPDELHTNDIFGPRGSLIEMSTTAGPAIQLRLRVVNATASRYLTTYLQVDGRTYQHVLDTASGFGRSYTDTWLLRPGSGPGVSAGADVVPIPPVPADHDLVVGVAAGPRPGLDQGELWEYRNSLGVLDRGALQLQTPGSRWRRITFPQGQLWFQSTLAGVLTETAVPAG